MTLPPAASTLLLLNLESPLLLLQGSLGCLAELIRNAPQLDVASTGFYVFEAESGLG